MRRNYVERERTKLPKTYESLGIGKFFFKNIVSLTEFINMLICPDVIYIDSFELSNSFLSTGTV